MSGGLRSMDALSMSRGSSAEPAPAIKLRGLRKTFGAVVAVDDLDLEIAAGQFFAMLGPSGSGKTTVLRMIAGFEIPDAGTIELGGVEATKLPPFRRDVNTVFQDYALFPHMTVAQNVGYGLRVRRVGKSELRARVAEALELVRLPGYGNRKPAQLSGGQRQRVALARALVNRPRVLLLDEPLGALDLKLREQMQLELKAIQRQVGITFVFVTHDQHEALTLCDRLAVFRDGRIEQLGNAHEVYESPATRFVAEFVGSSNLITGDAARAILGRSGSYAVRPEKIRLQTSGGRVEPGEICVDGVVREISYAGAETRVLVDAHPELALSATVLNATATGLELRRGDPVTLCWQPAAVRAIED
jgi:putative spermidine/putrescine transport system ATP-binding protein